MSEVDLLANLFIERLKVLAISSSRSPAFNIMAFVRRCGYKSRPACEKYFSQLFYAAFTRPFNSPTLPVISPVHDQH